MELDFDKYCVVDGSPTTVLPAPPPHRRRRRSKDTYRNLKYGNDMPSLDQNFTDISFNSYFSASCREGPSKTANHERGSVYQSSIEVNLLSKTDGPVGREKVELSRESASTLFPFGIIDSLCSSDEDRSLREPQNRSSVMSTSEQSTTSSFCKNQIEKDPAVNLLLAKLALPYSPACSSQSDGSKTSSPKVMFNSVRKKFDPFVSRSHKSSLYCAKETGSGCNETIRKPLVKDFSDNLNSRPLSSPAHLHGLLKSENKNGVPFFEFSVKSPEDVYYVAKKWKVDNALTWVYTFHSLHHKRKSNASGWGFKDNNRESTMVGQMVISCYLCTELKGAGVFNDSMVTEYVLYDIAQSRRSTWSQDNSSCSPDITKAPLDCGQNDVSAKTMNKGRIFKHSRPLAVAELHPELETAAIIMRVPFEKRESLKFKSEMDDMLPNLLDLSRIDEEEAKEDICDNSSRCGKMHVVIPAGNHSMPSSESRGHPSRLLDRWRLGGECDCGGWDMACPLDVFVNRVSEGQPLMDNNRHPVELFVQGRKDNDMPPAFSMMRRATEDNGKYYAVDFHARLSSLQAFSICVAILHAAEATAASSTAVRQERLSKQVLQMQSDYSLRVFAEDIIDVISQEEKFKEQVVLPRDSPFVINPPFSPIARV